MKVFVTGHRGYIGAHLVGLLKEAGHHVTGCDLDLFDGCGWEPLTPPDREIVRDVRQLAPRDLEDFDCVMHLAAISNDPMGDLDPEITRDINARGSIALAGTAKAAGVARFLLSSSCSIYGKAEDRPLAEEDARLRGLGEFFGARQHGLGDLRFGDLLHDFDLLELARADAIDIVAADAGLKQPEHAALRQAVLAKYGQTLDLAAIG